jgi:Ca2+-binding RTX toxin-like protein
MGDVVIEVAGGGRDTVQTMLTSYQLGAEVEKLVDFGTRAFTGTGNVLSNTIIGNIGNDTLSGLDGNDTMTGGQGDDVFVFNTAISATNHDTITDFKLGDDTIRLENTGAGLFNALPTGVLAASAFKLIGPGGAPQMPTTESSTNNPPNNCSTTRTALALEPPSSSLTCPICRSSTKLISS